MKLIKADGRVCWDENDMKGMELHSRDRPEIDRSALRNILLDSLQPDTIQWNRKLIRVEPSNDHNNKYDLHFTSSIESGYDLVIGADGAWSKVRPLLTNSRPHYSGITIIELLATHTSSTKPWLTSYVGSGSLFMFDADRAMVCQRNGNDSIRVYAGVRQPETWLQDCGIDWTVPATARKALVDRYFSDCGADIKRVIATEASDGLRCWPCYMLPIGTRWAPRPGVTLLGDAAHLMTPFAGVGVNVALADALDLAKALLRRKEDFEGDVKSDILAEAIGEYEVPMFERARANMEKTWQGLRHHFSADGIDERVGRLKRRAKMMEEERRRRESEGVNGGGEMVDEKRNGGVASSAS